MGPLYTSFQTCRIIFSVDPWDQKNKSALADLVLILQAQRDGDWQDPQAAGGARGAVAEGARHVQDRGAAQQHQDVRRHEETGRALYLRILVPFVVVSVTIIKARTKANSVFKQHCRL